MAVAGRTECDRRCFRGNRELFPNKQSELGQRQSADNRGAIRHCGRYAERERKMLLVSARTEPLLSS